MLVGLASRLQLDEHLATLTANDQERQQKPSRAWRTRHDPFAEVWESEVVPLLRHAPRLKAITLLCKLQEAHPGRPILTGYC